MYDIVRYDMVPLDTARDEGGGRGETRPRIHACKLQALERVQTYTCRRNAWRRTGSAPAPRLAKAPHSLANVLLHEDQPVGLQPGRSPMEQRDEVDCQPRDK
jgi:hypothetical protein